MLDHEQTPENPEEEKQYETPHDGAALPPQTGGNPGSGYFKPVSGPDASKPEQNGVFGSPAGGAPAGEQKPAFENRMSPSDAYAGGRYTSPYGGMSGGYRPSPQTGAGGASSGASGYSTPGYSPAQPPYGYGGQGTAGSAGYSPKKKKKRGNTGLVVAVIVLAFLLVVGSVAAGAYFIGEALDDRDLLPDAPAGEEVENGGDTTEKTPSGNNHAGSGVQYGDSSGFVNNGSLVSDDAISNAAVFCSKSVVAITTSSASYSAFYGNYVTQGAGSGVLYAEQTDDSGNVTGTYIVTNNHVIEGANEITVTLNDGVQYPAELVGTDAQTDVAVIYISATDLKDRLASIGESSSLLLGQTVLAIGNPLGELAGTVTDGIISCLAREIDIDGIKMNLLQTNAAVNPGNSGGGLFNLNGQLVGLVNAKSSGEGIEGLGFAIPVDTVKKIAGELMANGYVTGRPKIGISGYEVTGDNYQNYRSEYPEVWEYINRYYSASGGRILEGWYIFDDSEVQYTDPDNPFMKGDVISAIGGKRITDQNSITELLSEYEIGDTVTVTVWRLVEGGSQFRSSYSIQSYDIDVVLVDTAPEAAGNN